MVQPGTRPLEPSKIELVRTGLAMCDPKDLGARLVATFLLTGIHPEALAHPDTWHIDVRKDGQLSWRRPKTREPNLIPLDPSIREFLPGLLQELREAHYHPVRLNQLVHAWGAAHGIPELTPRALRHTFGLLVWRKTHDLNLVCRYLRCTLRVALRYIEEDVDPAKAEVIRSGWV